MQIIAAVLLASLVTFYVGYNTGRADSDLENYTRGYENAIEEIQGGSK